MEIGDKHFLFSKETFFSAASEWKIFFFWVVLPVDLAGEFLGDLQGGEYGELMFIQINCLDIAVYQIHSIKFFFVLYLRKKKIVLTV